MRNVLVILTLLSLVTIAEDKKLDVGEHNAEYSEKLKNFKTTYNKKLPQLFFCGDSISVGYGPAFKLTLQNKVNALHYRDIKVLFSGVVSKKYGGPAQYLKSTSLAVMNNTKYKTNFIMINSGLHDVHRGRKNFDKSIKVYLAYLQEIVDDAKKNKVKVIFLTTTKIGTDKTLMGTASRTNPHIERFNKEAIKLMKNNHVVDLSKFCTDLITKEGEMKILKGDKVHFTDYAQKAQAEFLAKEIKTIMKVK
jgi:lysophospholipase L1-like esterase